MRPILFLLAAVLAVARLSAEPLDPLLARADLWSLKQEDFAAAPEARGFQWTSSARDSARLAGREATLLGLPVFEALARFDASGKLSEITAAFYSRGDAGDLPKEKFDLLVGAAGGALNSFTKVKPLARGRDPRNAVNADGAIWQTPAARFLLEYSYTREVKTRGIPFRAEFVRLEITPPARSLSLLATAANVSKPRFTGQLQVKRDLNSGDVVITSVPMVDQGDKGYCAVACAERVMRYYGVDVDANELAQVANSDADRGTSGAAMMSALKKLATRLRVRVRPVEEQGPNEIRSLVDDYNRAAKRGSRAPLVPEMGSVIDVAAIYRAMKPDVLKEVRTKNRSDVSRFQRVVQAHIDQGIPLLWRVQLGLFPEPGVPQSGGGHMRLIIGYNNKTQEVVFSDSWGPGHEQKRKPLDEAWTITTGLITIEPM